MPHNSIQASYVANLESQDRGLAVHRPFSSHPHPQRLTEEEVLQESQLDVPSVQHNFRNGRINLLLNVPVSNCDPLTRSRSDPARYDDIHKLDDKGWQRVARARGIEELLNLGDGKFGSVAKCRLRKSGQVFAIKTIITGVSQEHMLAELKVNQRCNSPFIIKFFGSFVLNEITIAIAMEYCEGRSLQEVYQMMLTRGRKTKEKVLGKIACGVLGGLSYLHEQKIIHRDIKPGNILFTRRGEVKLCDFGISKEVIDSLCGRGTQEFIGVLKYMAPERVHGHQYSIRSDLWSLGISLMEVAQARFPFPPAGHPPLSLIDFVQYLLDTNIAELLEDDLESRLKWSESFRHFLTMCLEKDFKKRPSPGQMLRQHPWAKAMQEMNVDMERWIKEAWGWN